ncbi:MAG TPA: hypothetical protein VF494_01525 [Candidatus Limnocylindrales bacterium]
MTRRRPEKPETIIARLLRLGILSEVDETTGRRIAWSDDFRMVARGRPDLGRRTRLHIALTSDDQVTVRAWLAEEAAKVRADLKAGRPGPWGVSRPSAEDLIAAELFGPPEGFASRQLAVLDFLRQVGIVDGVEADPVTTAIRVELSGPYRHLLEAGREPDREPGFDAAWDAGGPDAVRGWLEEEARKLGWSGEPDAPEPDAADEEAGEGPSVDEDFNALPDLIEQVYGADTSRFMFTPHDSLGGRTPAAALGDGDVKAVWEIVLNALAIETRHHRSPGTP